MNSAWQIVKARHPEFISGSRCSILQEMLKQTLNQVQGDAVRQFTSMTKNDAARSKWHYGIAWHCLKK